MKWLLAHFSRPHLILSGCLLTFTVVLAVTNPALLKERDLWSSVSTVVVFVLVVIGAMTATPSTPPGEAANVSVNQPTGLQVASGRFGRWAGMIALSLGVPLAVLYFLVRFVKWAWTD